MADGTFVASRYFRTYHPRAAASCFGIAGGALSGLVDIEFLESNYDLSKAEIQTATNKGRLPN